MPYLTFLALFSVILPQKPCSCTPFPGLTKVFFLTNFSYHTDIPCSEAIYNQW